MNHHPKTLICIILTALTLTVFSPVQNHDFVNFDDNLYILDNQHVKSGFNIKNVSWALTTLHGGFWFPLTWLSHMLDSELYGINPKGHHFNNLLLHIVNSILLFLLLNRMTDALWRSAFVAALFALHPLHVEPVAWVSSRKDVLSTLFWMLTMWFYAYYTERPNMKRYLLVLLFFILGLMSKPMLVTLPFVLLLLDYWPLSRFRIGQHFINDSSCASQGIRNLRKRTRLTILILEKAPLMSLSLVSSLLVYFAERHYGALPSLDSFPFDTRFLNALASYISYIFKMIWPQNLAFFYPHPGMPQWWIGTGAGLLLAFVTFYAIKSYHTHPYLIVGWLWYLGTLVPVIGFIQVGAHAMADRYTYVPLIGLFIMFSWGVPNLLKNWRFQREILTITGGISALLFMISSWFQVQYWQNSNILFRHAIEVTSDNYVAQNNLGIELVQRGDLEKAIQHFSEALKIRPHNLETHNNMGVILARLGRLDEAVSSFSRVLQMHPDSAGANFNLGIALTQLGRPEEATSHFFRALRIKPDYPESHFNLGVILYKKGKFQEAITQLSKALYFKPDYKEAQDYLQIIKRKQEDLNSK